MAVLLACAALAERVADATLSWFPFFEQVKIVLWIWLLVSKSFVSSAPKFMAPCLLCLPCLWCRTQLASSAVVVLHQLLRPYESSIDWCLHTLDDMAIILGSGAVYLFQPFIRLWSFLRRFFRAKTPPTPVPVQRRQMRYSMRADFPGALPKTPAAVTVVGVHRPANMDALSPVPRATPLRPPQSFSDIFGSRHPTTEDAPVVARPVPAPSGLSAQPRSVRAPIKKKDANAPSKTTRPATSVLGKRKAAAAAKADFKVAEDVESKAKRSRSSPDERPASASQAPVKRQPLKKPAPQLSKTAPRPRSAGQLKSTSETDSKVPVWKRKFKMDEGHGDSNTKNSNTATSPKKRRQASRAVRAPPLASPDDTE